MNHRLTAGLTLAMMLGVASAHAESPALKVGVVPQFDAAKTAAIWQPILDQLAQRTGLRFTLVTSPDIVTFERDLSAGTFDLAYMNPFHFLIAKRDHGYVPLVRDGADKLQGIVVVRKSSPVKAAADLASKEIAFPAPNALAASLLVRATLTRDHKIPYTSRYLGNHTDVYAAVASGKIAAGGGVPRTLAEQPAAVRDQLRVVLTTAQVAAHPLAAHPRLPEAERNKVQAAILAIDDAPETHALLAAVPMKKAARASIEDYRQLMHWGLLDFYVAPSR